MSHSVHLSPAPDAGPFFESRAAHHRAALSPATPPSVSHRKQGPSSGISCDIWLSFAVMLQRKAPPLAGCEGRG